MLQYIVENPVQWRRGRPPTLSHMGRFETHGKPVILVAVSGQSEISVASLVSGVGLMAVLPVVLAVTCAPTGGTVMAPASCHYLPTVENCVWEAQRVHELAHTCGWRHFRGMGVPGNAKILSCD